MTETQFAAITGDLVGSRRLSPATRAAQQAATLAALEDLNGRGGLSLVRPAVLTAGDEVQAIVTEPADAFHVLRHVTDAVFDASGPDLDIVFGVGRGTLATGLLPEPAGVEQLDGPCFHRARGCLEHAQRTRTWVRFAGFGQERDRTLDALCALQGALRSGWTTTQHATTADLRRLGTRIAVARERRVSPSVVTESLQASRFDAVVEGESATIDLLDQVDAYDAFDATASSR